MPERYQYPFEDRYALIGGVRLHYVDEGSGPPIVLLHGQPTWSYLYRKMIPPLVAAGYRCIAPDLMGFGLSDKPEDESAYTLRRHVEMISGLIETLDLTGVTLVGQDWGGPIILRYGIEHKENVSSLVILNTLINLRSIPLPFSLLFRSRGLSGFLIRRVDIFRKLAFKFEFRRPVEGRVLEQYRVPHPTAASRAGIAAFPKMIPSSLDHPNGKYIAEIEETLTRWNVPVLVAFSDKDRAFSSNEGRRIAALVPNGTFHLIKNAGHYLQEDAGEEISERIISFLRDQVRTASAS